MDAEGADVVARRSPDLVGLHLADIGGSVRPSEATPAILLATAPPDTSVACPDRPRKAARPPARLSAASLPCERPLPPGSHRRRGRRRRRLRSPSRARRSAVLVMTQSLRLPQDGAGMRTPSRIMAREGQATRRCWRSIGSASAPAVMPSGSSRESMVAILPSDRSGHAAGQPVRETRLPPVKGRPCR